MKYRGMLKANGVLLTAALFLAVDAGADDWCPSIDGPTIYCVGPCTKTMTCDYTGDITIETFKVHLDGNGRYLMGGIIAEGVLPRISNLHIGYASGNGIETPPSSLNTVTTLSNVSIEASGGDGVYSVGGFLVVKEFSMFISNGGGIVTLGARPTVSSSSFWDNIGSGFYGSQTSNPSVTSNDFFRNGGHGAHIDGGSTSGSFSGNETSFNGENGLFLSNRTGTALTVSNNYGHHNSAWGCQTSNVTHLSVSGNTWTNNGVGDNDGCVNK